MKYDTRHGGPYDRGSADQYYGRRFNPHYYILAEGMFSDRIDRNQMSEDEIAAYNAGYNQETERKEW